MRGSALAAVLLSGLSLTGLSHAQTPADVHGWEKVKWGMTQEQIRKLYPKAQPYQPKDEAERNAMKFADTSALMIPSIELVQLPFEVNFTWKGTSKEIAYVDIYSRAGVTKGAFTELEKQLKLKYGEPASKSDKDGWFELTWMFPSTRIELWFHGTLPAEPAAVGIGYSPVEKRASEKQ